MIKVDAVFVNRLEKLSLIQLDELEREPLSLELTEHIKFIGEFKPLKDSDSPFSLKKTLSLDLLREDIPIKNHFPFFMNVPEHWKGYVII
ncbi:MAG TPA: hypothetical protein P5107_02460 [Thermotogota bacterium]|nr:hypothetical protein [Thermotogota bacterium]